MLPRLIGRVLAPAEHLQPLLAAYVRFQYTDGYLKLFKHVRTLPRADARVATAGLLGAAVATGATPLLSTLGQQLPVIPFEDVAGVMRSVPAPAFALALATFVVGLGFLVVGAALGPGALWIVVALQYVYQAVLIGLAAGRTWLHVVPLALPVAVGALTPGHRPWAQVAVAVIVASIAVRLSPLPAAWRASWYLLWPPAAAVFVGLYVALARRPWSVAGARLGLAVGGTIVYLAATGYGRSPRALAEAFHVVLNNSITLLELTWFLLGVSFVAGAIALGQFAARALRHLAPAPVPLWGLVAGWSAVVASLAVPEGGVGAPGAAWELVAVGLGLAVLAARWRMRGMTREWLTGWIVATVAVIGVAHAALRIDVAEVITREAGLLSIAGFTYAVVWEIASRVPEVPLATPRFGRPSPLLLYLGVTLVVGAAALFGLSANLKFFQQVVVLSQYRGALALWMAVGLRELLLAWPAFSADAYRKAVDAFLGGALLAVPVFLLRAAAGEPAGHTGAVAAVLASATLAAMRWSDAGRPFLAAVVGLAAALGFAASLSSRVLVALAHPLLYMLSALGGPLALRRAADVIFAWQNDIPWRPVDQWLYYGVVPALAASCAATVAWLRGRWATAPAPGGV
ncbi:MAG: hypothetical protein QN159_03815 [Armatimonadota bacterium]|nr:hypothetical protein [Armatimonadota bacterium]